MQRDESRFSELRRAHGENALGQIDIVPVKL
jgi:hypothetical protein